MNLLGNAIEYNRPGGTVELMAEVHGDDLHITVRDTGRGIAAEHLPNIFQPFYRASDHDHRAAPDEQHHLGLGLFLVDSHLKALGGTCKIESELGVGTTMRILLPHVAASEPAAAGRSGGMKKYRRSHCLFIKPMLKISAVHVSMAILRLSCLAALGCGTLSRRL